MLLTYGLAYLGLVSADINTMRSNYAGMIRDHNKNSVGRTLAGDFGPLAAIQEYGCYCLFADPTGPFESLESGIEPTDPIDALCKSLIEGYNDVLAFASDGGFECDPWTVEYNSITMVPGVDVVTQCTVMNPGNLCAAAACAKESEFVNDMFSLFFGGFASDSSLIHSAGFDVEATCRVILSSILNIVGDRIKALGEVAGVEEAMCVTANSLARGSFAKLMKCKDEKDENQLLTFVDSGDAKMIQLHSGLRPLCLKMKPRMSSVGRFVSCHESSKPQKFLISDDGRICSETDSRKCFYLVPGERKLRWKKYEETL